MARFSRSRLSAAVERHGATGLATVIASRLRELAHLDERHVWYVLDLVENELRPLASGYRLLSVRSAADLERAAVLPGYRVEASSDRLAAGNQIWLVATDQGEAAFACSIFFGSTPVRAATGHSLELPPGVACLEDSVTADAHRRRGIAGAAWSAIAENLRAGGNEVLITKVELGNVPSRKAVEKIGFQPAGIMYLRRRAFRERVAVERQPTELSSVGEATLRDLEERLER